MPASLVVIENRIEYRRGPMTEWYVNERRGIEQGFTLVAPPGKAPREERLTFIWK